VNALRTAPVGAIAEIGEAPAIRTSTARTSRATAARAAPASATTAAEAAGVPVRVRFTGWASAVQFQDELLSGLRNDLQLQSPGYEDATGRYDIEISGNASMVTISSI